MLELIAIAAAIALVFAVQWLRTVLAMQFVRMRARYADVLPADDAAIASAAQQLHTLGFGPLRGVACERVDGEAAIQPWWGCAVHREAAGTAWVSAPVDVRYPNDLSIMFSHRLADGRMAISTSFATNLGIGDTSVLVARALPHGDPATQWQAHLTWVATLGAVDPAGIEDDAVLDVVSGTFERVRQAMLQQRALRMSNGDVATPRLGYALRLMQAWRRAPRPPPDPRAVPPERLAPLAELVERVRYRSPPRDVQWLLFGVSVALFMAVGAVVWDARLALVLLVVILVHEAGHFFAMRAFGYRNVHLLALPLVGGAAIGVDAEPSATRRAWMSLMGPLPGIAIGWALLYCVLTLDVPSPARDWMFQLGIVCLLVNYLNALPVPPLDGAHVVDALLPLRWRRAQTAIGAIAAVAGAAIAWHFGAWLLVLLPLLHLLGVPGRWRLHRAEAALERDPAIARLDHRAQLRRVVETLDEHLGAVPGAHARGRILQAIRVQEHLRTAPMRWPARIATAAVYVALLAVPVAGLAAYVDQSRADERAAADERRWQQRRETLEREAETHDVAGLASTLDAAPPADAAAFDAAAARLGRPLPDEIRTLYAAADGIPALGIAPLAEVVPLGDGFDDLFDVDEDRLQVRRPTQDGERRLSIPRADVTPAWNLGYAHDPVLYWPDPIAAAPDVRIAAYDEDAVGTVVHTDLHGWLRRRWVAHVFDREYGDERARRTDAARARLANASLAELVETATRKRHWISVVEGLLRRSVAAPAEPSAIAEAERRIAMTLPDDYRRLLALYDGVAPLQLLPIADVRTIGQWRADDAEARSVPIAWLLDVDLEDDALDGCAIVAGRMIERKIQFPQVILCGASAPHPGVYDIRADRVHPDVRDWLLQRAAERQVLRYD